MASSSASALLLLLLVTISSPLLHHSHARDSQFFSKVTNTPTQTETVDLPNKEQEQQPEFIPQNQNGHGLYGQENTETKSGVQTQTPGTYASERMYNDRNDRAETDETEQFGNSNGETFYSNNGEKNQNDDASFDFDDTKDQNDDASYYNNNHNGVGTERYNSYTTNNGENYYSNKDQNDDASYYSNNFNGVGTEHYTTDSQKDNLGESETETYYSNADKNDRFGSQFSQTDNGFTNELNTRYNNYRTDTIKPRNGGGSNVVRQGMSDTRFMENGRYYYDVNKEQSQYSNQNTYKYNPNSEFGSREYQSNDVDRVNDNYYNNNNNRFYDNSGGEKYEFNSMEEYEQSRQNKYDP